MMNHFTVPDFDMEDDDQHLISSSVSHHKNEADEMMELLWQDGQVVAQPQHRRSQFSAAANHQYQQQQQHLFMAEDEMAAWLHYPAEDLYSELLCHNQQTTPLPPAPAIVHQPPINRPPVAAPQEMVAPPPHTVAEPMNFPLFARMRGKSHQEVKPELTVVESNTVAATTKTTLATMKSVEVSSAFPTGGGGETLWETGGGSVDMTLSLSSGTSGGDPANTTAPPSTASDEAGEKVIKGGPEDRKRNRTDFEDSIATPITAAATDQDVELEADDDEKRHPRGSHSSKRTRAAEVHNLSERRRRDRINEKMKALQELIPRCNKSDKASMLDEVIEYLKSLQMQVQMMSMGCGMVPMMYPGMQQPYMPPMGMAMGMEMGMNRQVMPFPPNIPVSTFPTTPAVAAGTQFAPNFSIPPVRMPSVPGASNFSINQGSNQANSVRGSYPVQTPGLPQLPNIGDPYQQFMALQQMQLQMQMQMQSVQNQSFSQPGSSKPSSSKSEAQPGPSSSKSEAKDHK